MSNTIQYRSWDDHMQEVLSDPEYAPVFLEGAIKAYLEDQDSRAFLRCIRYVVDAQIGMQELVKLSGKSEEELIKSLSGEANLNMDLLLTILNKAGVFNQHAPQRKVA